MAASRKRLTSIHHFHVVLFSILLLSGILLYLPTIRGVLADYRSPIRAFHIAVGLVYSLFLMYTMVAVLRYFSKLTKFGPRFNLVWVLSLAIIWVISGWTLEAKAVLPTIRSVALWAHDITSIFSVPWTIIHIITRIRRVPAKKNEAFLSSRREFLIFLGGSMLAFFIGGLVKWFSPLKEGLPVSALSLVRRGYFRIYTVTDENPKFDPKSWRLSVDGLIDAPLQLNFQELQAMPKASMVADFHCVTGWSVYGVNWEGVPFRELAKLAQIQTDAQFVNVYSADGVYVDSYRLEQLMEDNVLMAWTLDQQPLTEKQGAPLRLVVPKLYGYKSVKWVNRIEFAAQREPGYWEKRGYDLEGVLKG